ncbi:MAG: DNA sulfur modification protein DndD [Pyrinomonadaceae bacterium]
MKLLTLTIHNLGVFRGSHHFDFAPLRKTDGGHRHLTIVTGLNGVGKSTLFQALPLALHGSFALGDRISRQAYSNYLYSRLHRYEGTGLQVTSSEGGLSLTFEYVQSGRLQLIKVERSWKRADKAVQETLKVSVNDMPLDVPPEDYQVWLNDLISPGLASVCFFDSEQLDAFADPLRQNALLDDALHKLLGLNLVEQLQADLERYMLTQGGGYKAVDKPRSDIMQCQAAIDTCDEQLGHLESKYEALATSEKKYQAELAGKERKLISKGGNYALRRSALQERLTVVSKQREVLENQLRDMCGDLLPFSLAPKLCQSLSQRLNQEAERRVQQVADLVWKKRVSALKDFLKHEDFWTGTKVTGNDKQVITDRLNEKLRRMGISSIKGKKSFVHHLSETEQQELQNLITQSLFAIPQAAEILCKDLKGLQSEQSHINKELSRAPDNEDIAPMHAEILRLQESIDDIRQQLTELNNQIGALRFQRQEHTRHLQQAVDQLHKSQANERKFAVAERSNLVLAAYKDALVRQRLSALEDALTNSFNAICRKDFLLKGVLINPENFSVQLQHETGGSLSLNDFSAGERQLYALALLQGLRQASGRQLPLAIDTPLARLDEVHRHRLIQTYIPNISGQVILFTTDMEMGAELLDEAKPYLARIYRLDFDGDRKESTVIENYYLLAGTDVHESLVEEKRMTHVS